MRYDEPWRHKTSRYMWVDSWSVIQAAKWAGVSEGAWWHFEGGSRPVPQYLLNHIKTYEKG